MTLLVRAVLAAALTVSTAAFAAENTGGANDHGAMDHGAMDHGAMKHGANAGSPSTAAYQEADKAMHAGMARAYTGDADRDFLTGMIPHHQGAIEMAKVVLRYGRDPAVKKLAEEIVAAQEREIADMQRMIEAFDAAKKN